MATKNTVNNIVDDPVEFTVEDSTSNRDVATLSKALFDSVKDNLKNRILVVSLVPAVLIGILAVNYYYQYQLLKNNPQKVAQQQAQDLVAAVARLIVLPNGEEPTIATVADPNKLKDQPFFANARVGDKVLIYANARKAILYSPDSDKIIEVAPLNIGNPSGAPQEQPSTKKK